MERHLNAPDGNLLDYLIQNHSHHLELIGERWVHDHESPPALLWGKCIDEDVSIDGSMCKTHVTTCIKESLGRKLRATVSLSFSVHNLGVVCTERLKLTTFCLKDMEGNLCEMIDEWGLRDPHAVDRALGLLKPCIEQFKNINEQEGIIEL